jgi:hypothetical protein
VKSLESSSASAALSLCLAVLLASCGGGGNESGPADSLLASPTGVSVEGPPNACFSGPGPKVFIFGGQPPYKLSNSAPLAMTLDKTELSNSGDGFTLTFVNGCLESLPITVEDAMGRVLSVPISNVKGSN